LAIPDRLQAALPYHQQCAASPDAARAEADALPRENAPQGAISRRAEDVGGRLGSDWMDCQLILAIVHLQCIITSDEPSSFSALRRRGWDKYFRDDLGARAGSGYIIHPGTVRLPLAPHVVALPFTDL
jgi:hypothetical protein